MGFGEMRGLALNVGRWCSECVQCTVRCTVYTYSQCVKLDSEDWYDRGGCEGGVCAVCSVFAGYKGWALGKRFYTISKLNLTTEKGLLGR
jgi:hypothetical protein